MSEHVFEGKDIQDALNKAAQELAVTVDELNHEILEEAATDFWGLGETVCRVRVWIRETGPRESMETEPAVQPEAAEPAGPAPLEQPAAAGRIEGPTGTEEASPAPFFAPPEEESTAASAEVSASEERGEAEVAVQPAAAGAPKEAAAGLEVGPAERAEPGSLEEAASSLLASIFDAMEFDCVPEARSEGDILQIAISGEDNQYLLDGRGRGLSALELILNHAFRHRADMDHKKIRVDAGDFRSRREDELRDLAYQVAHEAKETGTTQHTQPLNPYERRIVHLTLADDARVTTRSQGSGFLKSVSIIPTHGGR